MPISEDSLRWPTPPSRSSRAKRGIPFGSAGPRRNPSSAALARDDRMNDPPFEATRWRREESPHPFPLPPSPLSSRAKRGIPFGSGALEKGIPVAALLGMKDEGLVIRGDA